MRRFILIVVGVLVFYAISDAVTPHDDTDPPGRRSQLSIYTDNATGCQYLGRLFGGVTPRLDRAGKPMCVAEPTRP